MELPKNISKTLKKTSFFNSLETQGMFYLNLGPFNQSVGSFETHFSITCKLFGQPHSSSYETFGNIVSLASLTNL